VVETVKVNLDKALISLKIMSIVAGALIACAVVYGNLDARINQIKIDQAVSDGVKNARLDNIEDDIGFIVQYIKDSKK
jgi:hypothetical protein